MSQKLFFVISGEHPTLPDAELKAALEAESCQFRLIESVPKLLLIEAPLSCLEVVSDRSSMCAISGIVILDCSSDQASVRQAIGEADLSNILKPNDSFSVRVVKAGKSQGRESSEAIEAFTGKIIEQTVQDVSVDLVRPKKPLVAIVYDEKFLLGLETYRRKPGSLASRRPRKRPVFHPSTMPPKLARCMVNLARPKKGDLVLDPFCGVGGLLIEAGLIGCRPLGCDLKLKMIRGSIANLKYFGIEPAGVLLADARVPPFGTVDRIVTDPPYGTAASTHGSTTREILEQFLSAAYETISQGGYICVGAPRRVEIDLLGRDAGLDLVERHEVYVHRSLTREIVVFRRK